MRGRCSPGAVAAALVVAVPGCARSHRAEPPALRATGSEYVLYMTLPDARTVGVYGLRSFTVATPVTLERAAPAVAGGVEVFPARVAFLSSVSGRRVTNGYPGGICTDAWPPRGYGPTYPVEGLDVRPGDVVAFVVALRPRGVGRSVVDGYDIAYRAHGATRHVREEERSRVEVEALAPGARSAHHVCVPTRDSVWLT